MNDMSVPESDSGKKSSEELLDTQNKANQKKQADAALFLQGLFIFLQKAADLIQREKFDLLKIPLETIAQACGYDDLSQALNQAKNARGQTALVQALQQQNFGVANALAKYAGYDVQASAEFDIAIRSEKGRKALASGVIEPPASYNPNAKGKDLHMIKEYGLVLGLEVTSSDNVPSQRGHIGPTYQMMSNSISEYANKSGSQDFKEIAAAFDFANKEAAFEFSTPTGSDAGENLAQRIQDGNKVTSVPISCEGHVMGLSFVPVEGDSNKTYLVFTNRGEGDSFGKSGTHIFEVDKDKITPEFINAMMNGHDKGTTHEEILNQIKDVTGHKEPVSFIEQKPQKYDNCTIANTSANVQGILLCQEANRSKKSGSLCSGKGLFDLVNKDEVKQRYKAFTNHMKSEKVIKLQDALKESPKNPDLLALKKAYLDKPNAKFKHHLMKDTAQSQKKEVEIRPTQ